MRDRRFSIVLHESGRACRIGPQSLELPDATLWAAKYNLAPGARVCWASVIPEPICHPILAAICSASVKSASA